MKATVKQAEQPKPAPIQFPVLMEYIGNGEDYSRGGGAVVLFTSETQGLPISGFAAYPVGSFQTGFINASNLSRWRKFTGSIELSN